MVSNIQHGGRSFTSARTLLALLRLSTALVRQRVRVRGGPSPLRCCEMSKQSLYEDQQAIRSSKPIDTIYSILREMADPDMVRFDEARQRILAKGYTPQVSG